MTIIKDAGDIHPDEYVDCEYTVSTNCLEGSIANDRRFDRVYDYTKKATVFICHPCTRLLAERGELVGIRSNAVQVPTIIRYEFPKS